MLSLERLKELLRYDPVTGLFHRLTAPGKRSDLIGTVAGYPSDQGYTMISVDNRKYRAHRLAWFYVMGKWPSKLLDHRNRVKNDNRWDNLREATKAQNEQSKGPTTANTSGHKGVYWNKCANKWQAYIKQDGQVQYLGIYTSFDEAVAARLAKEKQLFGDFAFQEQIAA